MIADPIPRALPWARWCCPFGALCARAALPIHWLVKSTTPKTGVPLGTATLSGFFLLCRVPKGTPIIIFAMLYQPMNWLAIQIPSLRDFTRQCRLTRCDSSLTRREASLHSGFAALHARRALHDAKRPYTPEGPYTLRSSLTRAKGTLHGATAPFNAATPPYSPSMTRQISAKMRSRSPRPSMWLRMPSRSYHSMSGDVWL